jgi:capsular exopolysaccharide synthesis family protein
MSPKKLATLQQKKSDYGYYSDPGEDFRMLRNNIEFSSIGADIKSITVTSGSPFEGKSTTTANLAVTMANTYKKVLLVDTDIRVPDLHEKFRIENTSGLTDALFAMKNKDSFDMTKYIQKLKHPNITNELFIITAGHPVPNSDMIFHSDVFKEFMDILKENFDMIICDTAPILLVADAIPVSHQTDATLFCVANKITKKDAAKKAMTLLKRNNVNVIGSIITMIKDKDVQYSSEYYSQNQYNKIRKDIDRNS